MNITGSRLRLKAESDSSRKFGRAARHSEALYVRSLHGWCTLIRSTKLDNRFSGSRRERSERPRRGSVVVTLKTTSMSNWTTNWRWHWLKRQKAQQGTQSWRSPKWSQVTGSWHGKHWSTAMSPMLVIRERRHKTTWTPGQQSHAQVRQRSRRLRLGRQEVRPFLRDHQREKSQSNGIIERAVGLVAGLARTLKAVLEHRFGVNFPPDARILCWL